MQCTITLQTLINDGLLNVGFSPLPPFTNYNITLAVTGTAPNYNINALAITSTGFAKPGQVAIQYDLAGEALRMIGPDGGETFQSSTTMSGYLGAWSTTNATYSTITTPGQIGVLAGSGTSLFSQFLRRDGTLPMTGALNMGQNAITNATDVATTSNGCSRTELTSSGQIISRNSNCIPQFITDPVASTTTLYGPAGNSTVTMDATNGRIGTNGFSPADLPGGWGGGIRTFDLYGSGTLAYGPSSSTTTTFNKRNSTVTYNGLAGFTGNGGGQMWAAGDLNVGGDIYLNNRKTPLNALLPSYSSRGAFAVANGQTIGFPNCDSTGGIPKIIVTPALVTMPIYAGSSGSTGYFYNNNGFVANATNNGSYWTVNISGWAYSPDTAYAMAHVYCYFGPGT